MVAKVEDVSLSGTSVVATISTLSSSKLLPSSIISASSSGWDSGVVTGVFVVVVVWNDFHW